MNEQDLEKYRKLLVKMEWIALYYDQKKSREVYGSTKLGQEMYYAYTHHTGEVFFEDDKHIPPIISNAQSKLYRDDLIANGCLVERLDWNTGKEIFSPTPLGHELFTAWVYWQDMKKQKKIQDRKDLKKNLKIIVKGLIKLLQSLQKMSQQRRKHGSSLRDNMPKVPDDPLPKNFWGKQNYDFK